MSKYWSFIEAINTCDLYFGNEIKAITIKPFSPDILTRNCKIFVETNFLQTFVDRFWHCINQPFIFVTGHSDLCIPYLDESNKWNGYTLLLENPNLIMWFAVNKDFKHPKLRSIPIGIPQSTPVIEPSSLNEKYMAWIRTQIFGRERLNNYLDKLPPPMESIKSKQNQGVDKLLYCCWTSMNTDSCLKLKFRGIRRPLYSLGHLMSCLKIYQ
jgi:hypothetical protein